MPAYALALSLLVTGPLLGPGYLLLRDAVSTPRSYLTDAALGLTEAAPRALPQDFLVAVVSTGLDGGVVVKILVVAGLWLAGWGAARLASTVLEVGSAGQFIAATMAIWNPYVAERLLQGHWSLLVGYGALPWVAVSMVKLRAGAGWGSAWGLMFWIALAGLTPTGLMLAATVALVCVAAPGAGWSRPRAAGLTRPRAAGWTRLRAAGLGLGAAILAATPWLVAAMVGGSVSSPDSAAGVQAFAARAEPGLATLGSLAGLGGIWNGDAVPESRTTAFAFVATVVLLGVVALGLPVVVRNRAAVPLLVLAAAALLIPAAMATGVGLAFVEAVVRAVPGLGVVRDGQKWVALAMPGYALAAAAAPATLSRLRVPAAAAAAVCCAALIAVLPDLAWGVGNQMRAVQYPASWAAAAAQINADPLPVVALPPDSMREFPWAPGAPVLDPLPRWVRAEVYQTGDLSIGGQTVPGEGARARAVQDLVLSGASDRKLAEAGVGWVVRESGGDVAVHRVGGSSAVSPHRGLMIGAHLVWLSALVVGAAGMVVSGWRVRRTGTRPSFAP
ncbi:hypothetical protein A5740_19580 [Mycobacterium sp. GA-1841]|nr:hypothetical protein A5740_19580 [Mycobacterium sp. GA-1841]